MTTPAGSSPSAAAHWPLAGGERRAGTVRAFDDARGLGTVVDDDGDEYLFHCTAITDGTRAIDAGTRVTFCVAPGHLGRLEGRQLSPIR